MTETERVSEIVRNGAGATMSLTQIIEREIADFRSSETYSEMCDSDDYIRNRSDVQRKNIDIQNRSNTKIEHPLLWKFISQKVRYMLSRPFTVSSESKKYAALLNDLMDDRFRAKVRSVARDAIKCGIAWIQPYFGSDGLIKFMRLPPAEVVPLWMDAEHTELDAFIRFYEVTAYEGDTKGKILRAEYWDREGVRRFQSDFNGSTLALMSEEQHFRVGEQPYNWERPPIVWLKYNDDELPLLRFVRELIDDINWQTSVTADVLRDVAKFIFVLRGYGGANLEEFVRQLRDSLAVKVDSDGGVDKLQADIDITSVMSFLDKQRRDVYDAASAVDTKDPDLGSASGTAINFRYMDLDSDCSDLAANLSDMFAQLKIFIDVYFQLSGSGNFTSDTFDVICNMDLPVNETDIINNAKASDGLISKRTILKNHPWVEDVDEELDALDEEKKKAMETFGEGLFDMTGGGNDGNGTKRGVLENTGATVGGEGV